MDWDGIIKAGAGSLFTGGAGFLGAYARFKQRLKTAEDGLKKVTEIVTQIGTTLPLLTRKYDDLAAGWRLEFDSFREEFERETKHRLELEEVRDEARASRPDPTEALRREVDRLRSEVERLKDRGSRYVKNDAFAAFTKDQEEQWRALAKTMGRLEGHLRGLKED